MPAAFQLELQRTQGWQVTNPHISGQSSYDKFVRSRRDRNLDNNTGYTF
jgi:hypothetical protein